MHRRARISLKRKACGNLHFPWGYSFGSAQQQTFSFYHWTNREEQSGTKVFVLAEDEAYTILVSTRDSRYRVVSGGCYL